MITFKKIENIEIQQPCFESWEKMQQQQGGKFCQSCQKIVVDFSSYSDSELIDFFKNYDGKKEVCGKFSKHQVKINIKDKAKELWLNKNYKWYRSIAMIGVMILTTARIFGQQIAGGIKPLTNHSNNSNDTANTIENQKTEKKCVKPTHDKKLGVKRKKNILNAKRKIM